MFSLHRPDYSLIIIRQADSCEHECISLIYDNGISFSLISLDGNGSLISLCSGGGISKSSIEKKICCTVAKRLDVK